jgi:hypothetical protein
MDIVRERIHILREMTDAEHIETAYRLMASRGNYEQEGINASLAVAHLLLAGHKHSGPTGKADTHAQ